MRRVAKLFPIILTVIGFAVLVGVIFYPNFKKEEVSSTETFATNISIDRVARAISMDIDSVLHFTRTPYTLTPADCDQEVNIKILDNLGNDKSGASYSNGYFKATELGTYYLRFFVANAYNGYHYDSIKITVYDEDDRIKQIEVKKYIATIFNDEAVDLNSMVEFVSINERPTFFRCNGQIVENGMFSASPGNYDIEAIIGLDGYEYIRNLKVIVKSTLTQENTDKPDDEVSDSLPPVPNPPNTNNNETESDDKIEDIFFNIKLNNSVLTDKELIKLDSIENILSFSIETNSEDKNLEFKFSVEDFATVNYNYPTVNLVFLKTGICTFEITIPEINDIFTIYFEVKEEETPYIDIEVRDEFSNLIQTGSSINVNLSNTTLSLSINNLYSSSQLLEFKLSDETVATIVGNIPPTLILLLNKIGSTTLTITNPTTNSTITIFINVVE